MACTTILVGKKASYDGSTLIARNDDTGSGTFCPKKFVVVKPSEQKKHYKSVISHVEIELPDNPMKYTACPSVDKSNGIWAASGINAANVGMTATETITTNPRVMGCDPLVRLVKAAGGKKEIPGGIGEEDLVVIVLPYIHSAKEGALRLGSLLEKYGTYENNGIAFSDKDEIWWLESIGGHNWIARRVKDDEYVCMPNQFGLDRFDMNDAYGAKKENLCSAGLKELVSKNHLNLNLDGNLNPRLAFGSHADSDHTYNTPRAWFMERYFNPKTCKWDGEDADFKPEDDNIPWSLSPERKITIEDIKYILSSHFQGTPYDPYSKGTDVRKGLYRPIGISRTAFMSICQIRPYLPDGFRAIEWVCFGSNVHNAMLPFYANAEDMPAYVSKTTMKVSTDNFYWSSRLLGGLADPYFTSTSNELERYQSAMDNKSHLLLNQNDEEMNKGGDVKATIDKANKAIAKMGQEETDKALDKILYIVSCHMKNGFSRSDN